MNSVVCYPSYEAKRERYSETASYVIGAARDAVPFAPKFKTLEELHEWVRSGRYVEEKGPCDEVRPVSVTVAQGGDCEDWAAVVMASAWAMGYPARLVAGGDKLDHARHVWAEVWREGQWIPLDAKGNQQGRSFGDRRDWEVVTVYGDAPDGSGVEADPILRGKADEHWMTPEQWRLYKVAYAGNDSKKLTYFGMAFLGNYLNVRRSEALRLIGQDRTAKAAVVEAKTGLPTQQATQAFLEDFLVPRTLLDVNLILASEWVATIPHRAHVAPGDVLTELAYRVGIRVDATVEEKRAGFALVLAQYVTSLGVLFDEYMREQISLQGSGASFWEKLVNGAKRLMRDPGGWFQRVFVTETGKGIARFAKNILNAQKNVPMLGKFFLEPLGFTLQAEVLHQLGRAMQDGAITTFDERLVAYRAGRTLASAGEALIAAAAFLPPPWNVAALALGALSKAVGETITYHIESTVQKRAEDRQIAELRKREAEAAQAVEAQRRASIPEGFQQYQDGYFYGWGQWSTGVFWTVGQMSPSGFVPVAVYVGDAWVAV